MKRDNYGKPVPSAAPDWAIQPGRVRSAIGEPTSEGAVHGRQTGLVRRWPFASGEVLSAFVVLGLGAACLAMLLGGHGSMPNEANFGARPATTVGPSYIANDLSALPTHLFIIVVGEVRAVDYRAYLVADALVRERIGELRRDAEVLAVATESEVATLAAIIADMSSIPGLGPVRTIIIQ